MSYMLQCECPKCGAHSVIFATKVDPPDPDMCRVCAERDEDVVLTITSVLVNVDGDNEEEPDV